MLACPKRIAFLLFLFPIFTFAQYNHELGFDSDNDAYFPPLGDEYYTNGLDIFFRIRNTTINKPRALTFRIGQDMYTPFSVIFEDPQFHDRPYAGYLYASGEMDLFLAPENLLTGGLEVGTTGEDSGAQTFQEFLHDIIPSFAEPVGWESQIGNEVGFRAFGSFQRLFYQSETGMFTGKVNASAGNQFVNGRIELSYLAGNMQAFNESIWTNFNSTGTKEFFWFITPGIELIGYDATLDGARSAINPVVRESKSMVLTGETGALFAKKHWNVKLSLNLEGKRTDAQMNGHQYLTIGGAYKFK